MGSEMCIRDRCGEDITGLSAIQINRKGMARTFQNIRLFNNMSVIRNVLVGMHNQKEYRCNFFESVFRLPKHFRVEKAMRDRAKELLRVFDLEKERNHLASNLPYGKQRKLEIARALATGPKLLLLDEPVTGLDPVVTAEFYRLIQKLNRDSGIAVIMVSHDIECAVENANKILHLGSRGVEFFGTTEDYLKSDAGRRFAGRGRSDV